jgi:hypothetical protein
MIYKGIYLGWVGFDNLGDEAMYELCRNRFPSVLWSTSEKADRELNSGQFMKRGVRDPRHVLKVLVDEALHQPRLRALATRGLHQVSRKLGREAAMLGGGTLINRNDETLERYVRARAETRSPVPVFGTGVCSPEFWSSERGWRDRRREWVTATAELPVVGVRGPRSKELLEEAGATNVIVSGDPAVAFHQPYSKKKVRERHDESLRIGINSSHCFGQLWGSPEKIQKSLAGLVRWLAARKHRIEFVPVQPTDVAACIDVARRAGMAESSISSVYSTAQSFLRYVETLDLLVAVKLHAGILSAAANVPFVLLEYQPKCRDFALSVGWEDFVPRTDELTEAVLIDRVSLLIDQLDSKKRELCGRMCVLMRSFEGYCRQIESLLTERRHPRARVVSENSR